MFRRTPKRAFFHPTTLIAVVLLLLILFVSVGYFFLVPVPDGRSSQDRVLAELATARETWQQRRPAAFRYVVERACACREVFLAHYVATEEVGFRNAEFPIAIETASGDFITSPPEPLWIEDVFHLIEEAAYEEASVEAVYDATYGFPTLATVRSRSRLDDGDMTVEIRDFEVLEYR